MTAYGENKIDVIVKVHLKVTYNNKNCDHDLYVVNYNASICGRDLMQKLNICLTGLNVDSRVNRIDLYTSNVTELIKIYKIDEN